MPDLNLIESPNNLVSTSGTSITSIIMNTLVEQGYLIHSDTMEHLISQYGEGTLVGEDVYYTASAGVYVSYGDRWVREPKNRYSFYILKRDETKAKKAIRKGIRLFSSLFGEDKIRSFLSGNSFTVEGKMYNYIISPKQSIIRHTIDPSSIHIPYRLEILSKGGLILAEGCTIFENTPIIDQLIAFILHIKSNEEHVLMNMNFSCIQDAFQQDDFLMTLKR